jgi:hypothetical protein
VIKIFISHSSKDVLLVKALIDLIRSALSIPASSSALLADVGNDAAFIAEHISRD